MIKRLTLILEDIRNDLDDGLREHDNDEIGELPLNVIYKVLRALHVPEFDEDIKDFFEYLLFRQSDSL